MNVGYILGLDFNIPVWILLIAVTLVLYYFYLRKDFDTFKKMGIPGPEPRTFLGNITQYGKMGQFEMELENRRKYGKIFGIFFGTPTLVIHDLDMLRQILVKEFPHFTNRVAESRALFHPSDPFSRMLVILKGDHWKHLRNALSPSYSTGKLKLMQSRMCLCADQLVQNIGRAAAEEQDIELRKMMQLYTMDMIASTAFGLQLDSNKNPNNQFVVASNKIVDAMIGSPKYMIMILFPFMWKSLLKISPLLPRDATDFYKKISLDIIQQRKQNKSKDSVDLMQLMADQVVADDDPNTVISEDGIAWNKNGLTKEDVISNSALFMAAGYNTTADSLCFVFYLLAVNPDCQDRLIEEIDHFLQGKEPHYEDLTKLTYLQQVIDETLRLYPPAPRIDRVVGNDIEINGLKLHKGLQVNIPIYALGMNPDVWPEPHKFDPDRFTAEQKASRDPLSYMPFGYGPRNCIGMRLALTGMKIAIVKILQKYRVVKCDKTQIPLELQPLRVIPKNGAYVRAVARE